MSKKQDKLYKPGCPFTVAKGRNKGKACSRPAGYQTDHIGFGPCISHGGSSKVWQQLSDMNLMQQIEAARQDPDLFDGRRELATARVVLEKLITQWEEEEYDSPDTLGEIRKWVALVIKSQRDITQMLIDKHYYMTTSQVGLVMRESALILRQEMQKAVEEYAPVLVIGPGEENISLDKIMEIVSKNAERRFLEELSFPTEEG